MKVTCLLATALALGLSSEHDLVKQKTDQYFKAMDAKSPSMIDLEEFYNDGSDVVFDSELPFGGCYHGPGNISTFLTRVGLTVQGDAGKSEVLTLDEAKGIALVLSSCDATFVRTNKRANLKLLHVLEWDQGNWKIIEHRIIDRDHQATLDAYHTEAEKKLWDLIWVVFSSSYEDVLDKNSDMWKLVSDDFRLKVNVAPEGMVFETEYQGKDDVIEAFKEWTELKMNMPKREQTMEKFQKAMDTEDCKKDMLKILHADDTDVFVSYLDNKAIVHYTFEQGPNGKLVAEEMINSGSLKPWELYPFPMPEVEDTLPEKKGF